VGSTNVTVIGAGLAGSEAAWQIASQGVPVTLYEMRPVRSTPAHHTDKFAELVCSNSLRANGLTNAVGVLKEEMRRLGSLILRAADLSAVPAGGALAVDRDGFSAAVTAGIREHPLIDVHNEEVTDIPGGRHRRRRHRTAHVPGAVGAHSGAARRRSISTSTTRPRRSSSATRSTWRRCTWRPATAKGKPRI